MGVAAAASTAGSLAGLLPYHGGSGLGRGAGRVLASSFASCPGDAPPRQVTVPVPPCVDGAEDCDTKEEFQQLRTFAKAVDDFVQDPLKAVKQARDRFERRVCDYQYAIVQDQSQLLHDTYGPNGPMLPGGSYLYELRQWSDAIHTLQRACSKDESCHSLLAFLQQHPEADTYNEGFHGKAGSKMYNELREACQVGKTRSPVPNDSPVWCDDLSGLCEQKSCRQWWRQAHGGRVDTKPWVDDRLEYDDLRDACSWITSDRHQPGEIDEYQRSLEVEQTQRRQQFCSPRWVEGYCTSKEKPRFSECVLKTGQRCKKGLVVPGSEQDETSNWEEPFKEPPVEMNGLGQLMLLQALLLPRPSRLTPRRRAAAEVWDFL